MNIEIDAKHSRNPRLDLLEIIAEALASIVQQDAQLANSEKEALAHLRNMTRKHNTQ